MRRMVEASHKKRIELPTKTHQHPSAAPTEAIPLNAEPRAPHPPSVSRPAALPSAIVGRANDELGGGWNEEETAWCLAIATDGPVEDPPLVSPESSDPIDCASLIGPAPLSGAGSVKSSPTSIGSFLPPPELRRINPAMMMDLTVNMRQEPTIQSALPEREVVDKSAATQQIRPPGPDS